MEKLDLIERSIVKLSKGFFKVENKQDLLKKLIAYSYGLDTEHVDDHIILKNTRRLYFKLNPDEDILDKIERMESEINRRFYPVTPLEYWLSEISMIKIYSFNGDKKETLVDIDFTKEEEEIINEIVKYNDLTEIISQRF